MLAFASPLVAEELSVSALKAFTAKMDEATARCDIDTVVDRVAELAIITLNQNDSGGMRILRMNKSKYREFLTIVCSGASGYQYARAKVTVESIDGKLMVTQLVANEVL